jgi:hypothetical protein
MPTAGEVSMSEEVRRTDPDELDGEITEGWERLPDEEKYLRGVEVDSGEGLGEPFDWLVTIWAREYFRDDPVGQELKLRLESAMLAVPGVIGAENASWETWYVTGKASGEALCQACADVLDELADQLRAAYHDM